MHEGGEQLHQPESEAIFTQAPVQDYIDTLAEGLDDPLSPPLREGFAWFLEDAVGVNPEELSDDERRLMEWCSGWDHWTVQNLGNLFNRARSQAYREGAASEPKAELERT